jgi:uncharacterized protein YjcR
MGAPMGNRNAAGGRGGSATNRMRAAAKRGRSRLTMSRLTGKKPKMTKMQSAIARGRFFK